MKVAMLTSFQTAVVLWKALGPLRAWDDFLSDCRRYKTDLSGVVLLPACRAKIGRAYRPLYSVKDIRSFVAAIRARVIDLQPATWQRVIVEDDPKDSRHWKHKKYQLLAEPGLLP